MELSLSKHFIDQWRKYFNEDPPSSFELSRIISQAIWLQKFQVSKLHDGREHRQLASYWHTEKEIIVKVDWRQRKAVTVITPRTEGVKDRIQKHLAERIRSDENV